MVFLSHIFFHFDLFDLSRVVDGKLTAISSCWNSQLLNQTVPRLASHRRYTSIKFHSFASNGQLAFLESAGDGNYFPRRICRTRGSTVESACEAYTLPTELPRPLSNMNCMLFGISFYMKGVLTVSAAQSQ